MTTNFLRLRIPHYEEGIIYHSMPLSYNTWNCKENNTKTHRKYNQRINEKTLLQGNNVSAPSPSSL